MVKVLQLSLLFLVSACDNASLKVDVAGQRAIVATTVPAVEETTTTLATNNSSSSSSSSSSASTTTLSSSSSAPTVVSVSSDLSNGTYVLGETISIRVTFDQAGR